MSKKKLIRRGLCLLLVFAAAISLFVAGFAQAAEKPAAKATPKPAVKQAPKEQPQTGGILKIIEATGPKTPFGWPVEGVGEASIANKPVVESLAAPVL